MAVCTTADKRGVAVQRILPSGTQSQNRPVSLCLIVALVLAAFDVRIWFGAVTFRYIQSNVVMEIATGMHREDLLLPQFLAWAEPQIAAPTPDV